eukprot:TRINITY_DN4424_c0_g1_i1.p1 TRINITY_DN4424_c0_g1~~TRINITY_DN4424_c0_g1_i1.p1  ORF type:complete len:3569 (-),score=802.37 TRINITY_DN4424_c0_g1_i1:9-9890(-)
MDDLMVAHPPPADAVVVSGSQPGGRVGGVSKFHHYILNPISGLLKLTLSNSSEFKIDVPKTQLDLELEAVRLGLNRVQFSTILDAIDYMTAYNKNVKYLKFRPKDGITPRENPRAWWRYVINSVRQTIHERNEQWTWSHMMEWKKDRQTYIDLYKERKLGKRKLKPLETAELDRLEVKHSYKTLLTWRRLANAAIDLRKQKKKETKEKEKSDRREKRKALISKLLLRGSKESEKDAKKDKSGSSSSSKDEKLKEKSKSKSKDKDKDKDKSKDKDKEKSKRRSIFGRKKDKDKKSGKDSEVTDLSDVSVSEDDLSMSVMDDSPDNSEISTMSEAIDDDDYDGIMDDDDLEASDASVASTTSSTSETDQQASQALRELYQAIDYDDGLQDEKEKTYPKEYIKTAMTFKLANASLELLDALSFDSRLASLDLNRAVVTVGLRSGGSFIVSTKLKTIKVKDYFTLGPISKPLAMIEPDLSQIEGKVWKILSLDVEKKPPNGNSNLRIDAKVLPLTVTLSKPFLDRLISFFKPKRDQSKNLQKLAARAASKSFASVQKTARNSLKLAFSKRKILQLDVDVQAPRIILPEDCSSETSPAVIVDLGHLLLQTDTTVKSKKSDDSLYDTYQLKMTGLAAIVLSDRSQPLDWKSEAMIAQYAFLHRFDFGLNLQIAGVAAPDIPKFRLAANLPNLQLAVTQDNIRSLISVVRAITAKQGPKKPKKGDKAGLLKRGQNFVNLAKKAKNRDKLVSMIESAGPREIRRSDSSKKSNAASTPVSSRSRRDLGKRSESKVEESEFGDSDSVGDDDASPRKKTDVKQLAEATFDIGRLAVVVSENTKVVRNKIEEMQLLPLVVVDIKMVSARLSASNVEAQSRLELQGLIVEDKLSQRSAAALFSPRGGSDAAETHLLLSSYTTAEEEALIHVDLNFVDKRSPNFSGVGVVVGAQFGALEMNLARPTLAAVLHIISEFGRKKPKRMEMTLTQSNGPANDGRKLIASSLSSSQSSSSSVDASGGNAPNTRDLLQLLRAREGAATQQADETRRLKAEPKAAQLAIPTKSDSADPQKPASSSSSKSPRSRSNTKSQKPDTAAPTKVSAAAMAAELAKEAEGKKTFAQATVTLKRLQLTLKKEARAFFTIRLSGFNSQVEVRKNMTIKASGYLGDMMIKQIVESSSAAAAAAMAAARFFSPLSLAKSEPSSTEGAAPTAGRKSKPKSMKTKGKHSKHRKGVPELDLDQSESATAASGGTTPTTRWLDLVTIDGDKVVSFSVELFSKKAMDYPGYSLAISSTLGKLRLVAVQRIFAEVLTYFQGLMKMRAFLGKKPPKPGSATQKKDKSGIKLNLEIANPLIIVPQNSGQDDHMCLDLGKITVTNRQTTESDMKIEAFDLSMTDMNIQCFLASEKTGQIISCPLFSGIDVDVVLKRSLTRDLDHRLPDLQVGVNISKPLTTVLSQDKIFFLLRVLGGNLSENPIRPDEAEFTHVMELLQSTTALLLSAPLVRSSERSNYVRYKVDIKVADIQASIAAGSAVDSATKSIGKVVVSKLATRLAFERDGSVIVNLDAEAFSVVDTREDTPNQYRQILTAIHSKDEADAPSLSHNLLVVKFESRPKDRYQSAAVKLIRPRVFMIPSAMQTLVEFGLPVLNDLLRAVNQFTKRRKVGGSAAKKIKYLYAEGLMKQRHTIETQELAARNAAELQFAEKQQRQLTLERVTAAASDKEKKAVKATLDKDTQSILASLRLKHDHKAKALKQAHNEQMATFQAESLVLLNTIASRTPVVAGTLILPPVQDDPKRQKRERKIKLTLQSPSLYAIKDAEAALGYSTAFVLQMSDMLMNYIDSSARKRADLHLFELYAVKCDVEAGSNAVRESILLLKPFNIDASVERIPAQKLLNANVEINVINTIISHKDLRGAIGVLRSFRPMLKSMRAASKTEKARKQQIRQIVAQVTSEAMGGRAEVNGDDDGAQELAILEMTAEQQATLRIKQLEFSLLNDANPEFVTPLVKFEVKVVDNHIHLMKGRRKLSAMVDGFQLSAYNPDLAAYEPVIEPWNFTSLVKQDIGRRAVVELTADKTLNLNLTKSLVDTAFSARQFIIELTKKPGKQSKNGHRRNASLADSSSGSLTSSASLTNSTPSSSASTAGPNMSSTTLGRTFSPFIIQNQTFKRLKYWFSGTSEETSKFIEPRSEAAAIPPPVILQNDESSLSKEEHAYEIDLQLQHDDAPVFKSVPLDKVHLKGYTLSTEKKLFIVTQVVNKAGTKVLTVRTSKFLENKTNQTLEIMILDTNKTTPHRAVLEPGTVQSIPLEYFQYKAIYFRPKLPIGEPLPSSSQTKNDYSWFEWHAGQGSSAVVSKDESSDQFWCCSLKYEEPLSYGDITDTNYQAIYLQPCFMMENLLVGMLLFKMSSDRGKDWDYSAGLEPGEETSIYTFRRVQPQQQTLSLQLGGFYWSVPIDLSRLWDPKLARPYTHTIEVSSTSGTALNLFAEVTEPYGHALKISLYSKYWIVNQTGLPLSYRPNYREGRFGEVDKRVMDMNADPRNWYFNKKDDFKSSLAAQKFYYPHDEIQIQVQDSEWSQILTLDAKKEDRPEVIVVNHAKSNRAFAFTHKISTAPGRFWRTSEIRFLPSVVLVNKTKQTLLYGQFDDEAKIQPGARYEPRGRISELLPDDQIPFHWPYMSRREKFMQINFKDSDTHWSGKFKVDQIDNFMLKVRQKTVGPLGTSPFQLVNVSIKSRRGITYVVFRPGEENFIALYQVENQTGSDLIVCQKYVDSFDLVPAKQRITLFWDEVSAKKKIVLRFASNNNPRMGYEHNFEKENVLPFGEDGQQICPEWEIKGATSRTKYRVSLLTRGYTNVLLIYDEKDIAQNAVVQSMIKTDTDQRGESLEVEAKFSTLAISLIDTTPQEVVYVQLQNTSLRVDKVGVEYMISFSAQTGQVDNQLYRAPEPVAVYPIPRDENSQTAEQHSALAVGNAESSFITFEVHIDQREAKITHFNKISFAMQPIDLNLDQIFILKLQAFFAYMMKYIGKKIDQEALVLAKEAVLPLLPDKTLSEGDKFYFQNVEFKKINAVLSLRRGSNKSVTTVFKGTSAKRILENILAVSSIERQSIVLNSCEIQSAFCSWNDFTKRIVKHYTQSTYSHLSGLLINFLTHKLGRNLFNAKRAVSPIRPPRYFPPDNLVVLFDLEKSYGQRLLRSIKGRVYVEDNYYFHYWISTKCIIGSQNFLILLEFGEIVWQEKMRDVIAQAMEDNNTIKVFLLDAKDTRERIVECRTKEQVEYISANIDLMIAKNKSELSRYLFSDADTEDPAS